jgi:hypothetical protein
MIQRLVSFIEQAKCFHHHQPINVSTARAQAFLIDYLQGELAITHHVGLIGELLWLNLLLINILDPQTLLSLFKILRIAINLLNKQDILGCR